MKTGHAVPTERRPVADFAALQRDDGTPVVFPSSGGSIWTTIAAQWLPMVVLFLFFVFFMRRLRGGNNSVKQLEFAPAAVAVHGPVSLRGLSEAREALTRAAQAIRAGTASPTIRRVLISGPPGSGKTQLVRAIAADSGLPLMALSGSAFVEIFVGVGASRVRKAFEEAAKVPCVFLIDDVDAFAVKRTLPQGTGVTDERGATLLELTNRLDGATPFPTGVLFVCTTSRFDLLDEALCRAGRIDLHLELRPDGTSATVSR
jgi:cell division protease FtsH